MKWWSRWFRAMAGYLTPDEIHRPVTYLVLQDSKRPHGVTGYIPKQVVVDELGIPIGESAWFTAEQSKAIHEHPMFVTPEEWQAAGL